MSFADIANFDHLAILVNEKSHTLSLIYITDHFWRDNYQERKRDIEKKYTMVVKIAVNKLPSKPGQFWNFLFLGLMVLSILYLVRAQATWKKATRQSKTP